MPVPRKFAQAEIGPAVDTPWASAVEAVVAAGQTIAVNDILIINGRSSGLVQVRQADADALLTSRGVLYIAVTAGGAGSRVTMVPWRVITGVNTAAGAVGDSVYLSGTDGAWSLTPGATSVKVGEVLVSSATAGVIFISPGFFGGEGATSAGTEALTYTINDDAAAATDEDPRLRVLGGDGGAEIIRSLFYQDSSADRLYLSTALSTVALTGSDRTTWVTVGPMGDANAAGNAIDSTVTLRYHVAGDAVATWRTATISASSAANALQINGSSATLAIDIDAGGALTLDSSGGAISIGADAVAQAINIGTGAAARTVTIGNVTGATAVVVNAGTGASAWTVTGAGTFSLNAGTGAITLASNATDHALTVGSVTGVSAHTMQSGTGAMTFTAGGIFDVNATGAVTLDSSGAAISIGTDVNAFAINVGTGGVRTITVGNATGATGVVVNVGTGPADFGANATDHTSRFGSTTGVSASAVQSGTGAMTFTAGGAFDVNATGLLTIDSSGGIISIGADAVAQNINIGTGAAARVLTIGNAIGVTSVVVNLGTGAADFAANATDHTTRVGSATGVSATTLQAGTGAMTFTAGGVYDVNATGALTIDSSGGAIGIGTDAVAQAINVGTGAAARTITVGNAIGTTSIVMNSGTGTADFAFNATDHATRVGSATGASATTVQSGTGGLTLTSGGTATWALNGNAGGALSLQIDAINAGVGSGGLILTADDTVQIGDAGNPAINFSGAGAITHSGNPTIGMGTGALTLGQTSLTTSAALVWTLLDNNAASLSFDAAGAPGIMVLVTTNGAEAVTFRENALTNLAIGSRDVADAAVDVGFFIRKTYLAGASTTDFALPARVGGWRVTNAYIISGGASGGTVQIQTAGGAANVSDAMVPAASGNGGITRAASLLNNTFASGATVRLNIAAMAPAGEAFIRVEPL